MAQNVTVFLSSTTVFDSTKKELVSIASLKQFGNNFTEEKTEIAG